MSEARQTREEFDEQENARLGALIRKAQLRGSPVDEQRCDTCRYYVGEYKKIAYCNHPELELLVGADWWCQWWEARES